MIGGVLDRGLPSTLRGEGERRLPVVKIRVGERWPPNIRENRPGRLRLPSSSIIIGCELRGLSEGPATITGGLLLRLWDPSRMTGGGL